MPEDGNADPVEVKLDGAHLRVDARPARLVSQLRGASGDPVFTAHAVGSDPHTEAVPSGARQCTFQLIDELSVEATRAADFVALIAEQGGRRVIVAFTGEVTVVPGGSDDRFALAAHEALLIPGGGGEPRVVPADSLSEADQDEISSVVEEASLAVVSPSTATETGPTEDAPTEEVPAVPAEGKAAATGGSATGGGSATQPSRGPGGQSARAGGQKRQGGKKGKKGRPQPGPAKKAAPLVPGGAGAAGAAGGGGAAAGAPKKTGSPTKKAGSAPAKKAASGRPTSAGAAKTSGRGDDGDDRPQNRGLLAWAGGIGVLIALVVVVFVLTRGRRLPKPRPRRR
jgi:hypothetical protein